jgi:hypothetical protein
LLAVAGCGATIVWVPAAIWLLLPGDRPWYRDDADGTLGISMRTTSSVHCLTGKTSVSGFVIFFGCSAARRVGLVGP